MAFNGEVNGLSPLEEENNNAFLSASALACGPISTAVLNAALELNIFEMIAKASPKGVSASEIASQLPKQHPQLPQRLDRMLCLLASHSLLTCSTRPKHDSGIERLYQLTLAGRYFLNDESTGSLALFPKYYSHQAMVDVLLNFKEVLLDCDSDIFNKINGVSLYQFMQRDSEWNNVFNKAMVNLCIIKMNQILEKYNGFEGISLLVDVGGGVGQNLNMIMSKYPSIKGINFDLPEVIQTAPAYPGIQHVGGDMFERVPNGDAIILKVVCHNWSDQNCLKLLRNCYKALPPNGKMIVVDFVMPETIQSSETHKFASCMDNSMFIFNGRERTMKEFENLCKDSGFSKFQVVCNVLSVMEVMEFYK